jgi:hypothetical protein
MKRRILELITIKQNVTKVLAFGILLVSVIGLTVTSVSAIQIWGDLDGTVTDAESGDPISGVTITATADVISDSHDLGATTTDASGQYLIEDLNGNHPVGKSYTVKAEKTGYVTQEVTGVLIYSANDPPTVVTTQDFQLQRIRVNAVYGSTPTLDGVVDPEEEWGDAEKIVLAEGVYVKKNCSHFHVGFMVDYSAGPPGSSDRAVVLFDVNHDNGTAPQVDDLQLAIYYDGTLAELHGTGSDWTTATPTGWQGYSATTPYSGDHCYEYSIPYSKIGVTSGESDTLGIALGYYVKGPLETHSYWWPKTIANSNKPDSWTDLMFQPKPTIESCDSMGITKNSFNVGENLYVKGSGYGYPAWIFVTITKDITWTDQMPIPVLNDPDHVWGVSGFQSNTVGELIPSTFIWLELDPGKYDIVVDVNDNGVYDECVDALDDFDIDTAGFFVVPEVAVGSLMAAAAMFAALGLFAYKKKQTPKQ